MDVFAEYPIGSKENPFAEKSKGKYFTYLTNRKKCFSFLSDDINDFKYNNNELYKAMPMGYTTLCVLTRVFIVSSETEPLYFEETNKSVMHLYCVVEKTGNYKKISEGELLEMASLETRTVLHNIDVYDDRNQLKKYHLFMKKLKGEICIEKIVMIGAILMDEYNWH